MKTKIAATVLAFGAIVATAGSASAASSGWIKQTPTSTAVVSPWHKRPPASGARVQPWLKRPPVSGDHSPVVWVKYR